MKYILRILFILSIIIFITLGFYKIGKFVIYLLPPDPVMDVPWVIGFGTTLIIIILILIIQKIIYFIKTGKL